MCVCKCLPTTVPLFAYTYFASLGLWQCPPILVSLSMVSSSICSVVQPCKKIHAEEEFRMIMDEEVMCTIATNWFVEVNIIFRYIVDELIGLKYDFVSLCIFSAFLCPFKALFLRFFILVLFYSIWLGNRTCTMICGSCICVALRFLDSHTSSSSEH